MTPCGRRNLIRRLPSPSALASGRAACRESTWPCCRFVFRS